MEILIKELDSFEFQCAYFGFLPGLSGHLLCLTNCHKLVVTSQVLLCLLPLIYTIVWQLLSLSEVCVYGNVQNSVNLLVN